MQKKTVITDPLVSIHTAGEALDTTAAVVSKLVRQGHIRGVRVGRALKIQESAIREFISHGGVNDRPQMMSRVN